MLATIQPGHGLSMMLLETPGSLSMTRRLYAARSLFCPSGISLCNTRRFIQDWFFSTKAFAGRVCCAPVALHIGNSRLQDVDLFETMTVYVFGQDGLRFYQEA
jgi:hypothetical protein